MPLTLNLGLSRKVGEANYGSRGASINLEVEIDSALAADLDKLHERIRQLFAFVRMSLAEELNGSGTNNGHAATSTGTTGSAAANVNGHPGTATTDKPRMATASQLNAINAIAHRQRINLMLYLQNQIGVSRPTDLTLKQASQVIDALKAVAPQGG